MLLLLFGRLACLAASAMAPVDVQHLDLNDDRTMIKSLGASSFFYLMETVSSPLQAIPHLQLGQSGVRGGGGGGGVAESTCRRCPEAHLSTCR